MAKTTVAKRTRRGRAGLAYRGPDAFTTNMRDRRDRIGGVKWTQRDGTKICLRDMTLEHIGKCIIMLMKKIEDNEQKEASSSGGSLSGGEFSQMEAELSDAYLRHEIRRLKAMISIFRDELMFRAMPEFTPDDFRAVADKGETSGAVDHSIK